MDRAATFLARLSPISVPCRALELAQQQGLRLVSTRPRLTTPQRSLVCLVLSFRSSVLALPSLPAYMSSNIGFIAFNIAHLYELCPCHRAAEPCLFDYRPPPCNMQQKYLTHQLTTCLHAMQKLRLPTWTLHTCMHQQPSTRTASFTNSFPHARWSG